VGREPEPRVLGGVVEALDLDGRGGGRIRALGRSYRVARRADWTSPGAATLGAFVSFLTDGPDGARYVRLKAEPESELAASPEPNPVAPSSA
jgi:hypothetical protein